MMNDKERKAAAKNFAAQWINRGDEKQETELRKKQNK